MLKSSLSTIKRERERERERERGGGRCVASLKKNLPFTFFFDVIDPYQNRCTTFRECTFARLKVKENDKMNPRNFFFSSS